MSNTVKSLEFTFDTTFPELCEHISFEKISENEFFVKKGDNGIIEVNKYVFLFIQLATGQNSIVDICRKMEISVSNDNLNRICDLYFKNLAKYGIIKNKHNRTEKKGISFNLTFTIINADIVNFFCKKLKFLYNQKICLPILICFIFLIATNLYIFFDRGFAFRCDRPLLVCILVLLSFFAHEFGHSSAICYYGKNAGKIGVGLLLLAPIMFSDVSECWGLSKWKRVIVDLGGLYFQIIFATICLTICLFTSTVDFLYSTIVTLSVGLINLNPFIKMDGYWLLSDILDIKNLKSKSEIEAKTLLKQLFSSNHISKKRHNTFLIIYCILNTLLAVSFFLFMVILEYNLLREFPNNTLELFNCISNNQYSAITIQTIESIILPIIVLLLLFLLGKQIINKHILTHLFKYSKAQSKNV